MEVIPIHMNNTILKTDLWTERIHAFQESGLSRKDWCQQNEVPLSTLSYWIRKFQSKATQAESLPDPVFARLPAEQDLQSNAITGISPITIVFCQVLFPEKSVGIPFFQQGIFPAFSGHYASLRMRPCSIR